MDRDTIARQMFGGRGYNDLSISEQIRVDDAVDAAEESSKGSGLWRTQDLIDKGAQVRGVDLVLPAGAGYEQRFYRNANNPDLWTPASPTQLRESTGTTSSGPRIPEGLRTEAELINVGARRQGFDYVLDVGDGYVQRFYQDEYNPGRYRSSAPTRAAGASAAAALKRNDVISLGAAPTELIGTPRYDTNLIGADTPGVPTTVKVTIGDLIDYTLAREGITPQGTTADLDTVTALATANQNQNEMIMRSLGVKSTGDPLKDQATAMALMKEANDPSSKLGGSLREGTFGVSEAEATKYARRPSARERNFVNRFALGLSENEQDYYGIKNQIYSEKEQGTFDPANYTRPEQPVALVDGGTIMTNDPLAIVNMRTKQMIGMTSEYGQPEKTSWDEGKIVIDPLTMGFAAGATVVDNSGEIARLQNLIAHEMLRDEPSTSKIDAWQAQITSLSAAPIDTSLPGTVVTPGTPPTEPEAAAPTNPFAAIAGTSADTAEATYLAQQARRDASTDYIYNDYAGLATPSTVTLPFSALGLGGEGGAEQGITDVQAAIYRELHRGKSSYLGSLGFTQDDWRKYVHGDGNTESADGVGAGFVNIKNLPQIPGIRYQYPNIGAEISALQARLLTTPVDEFHTTEIASMKGAISKLREAQIKAYPWINRPPPLNQPTLAEDPFALVAAVGKKK